MLRVDNLLTEGVASPLTFEVADGRTLGLLGADRRALERIAQCVAGLRAPSLGSVATDAGGVAMNLRHAAHALTTLGEHLGVIASARGALRMSPADAIARMGASAAMRLNSPEASSVAALLAAVMPSAAVIVLHEPFRDLDAATRIRAVDWIRSLADTPTSILVTGTEERDVRAISHTVMGIGPAR